MVQGNSVLIEAKRIRSADGIPAADKVTGGQEVTKMVFYVTIFLRLSHAPGLVLLPRCLTTSSLLNLKTLTRPTIIQRRYWPSTVTNP